VSRACSIDLTKLLGCDATSAVTHNQEADQQKRNINKQVCTTYLSRSRTDQGCQQTLSQPSSRCKNQSTRPSTVCPQDRSPAVSCCGPWTQQLPCSDDGQHTAAWLCTASHHTQPITDCRALNPIHAQRTLPVEPPCTEPENAFRMSVATDTTHQQMRKGANKHASQHTWKCRCVGDIAISPNAAKVQHSFTTQNLVRQSCNLPEGYTW
jgi:hypothetical protein